jgi:hypothetical protein
LPKHYESCLCVDQVAEITQIKAVDCLGKEATHADALSRHRVSPGDAAQPRQRHPLLGTLHLRT